MSQNLSRQLLEFLDAAPSCYHAAENVAAELRSAGYEQLWEGDGWNLQERGRYFVMRGDSSVIAFRVPEKTFKGFMIAAESPFVIAALKNAELIISLFGRPKEMFETPRDV